MAGNGWQWLAVDAGVRLGGPRSVGFLCPEMAQMDSRIKRRALPGPLSPIPNIGLSGARARRRPLHF
jgi:hypothetical protein